MRSLIVLSFLLCGCSNPPKDPAAVPDGRFKQQRMEVSGRNGVGLHVITDTLTGRQYLAVYNCGVVPLRFDDDEKTDGTKDTK